MRTAMTSTVMAVLTVCMITTIVPAQVQPTISKPIAFEDPLTAKTILLSPQQLPLRFESILKNRGVTEQKTADAAALFKALPTDLQATIIVTLDEDHARIARGETLAIARMKPEIINQIAKARLFFISTIWPQEGSVGGWSYAFGRGFGENCVVHLNGAPIESHYLGMGIEFFPNSMAFKIPQNTTRGQEHQIHVRDTQTGKDTSVCSYMVVAPRGYRGHHGWQFSNFSRASIDWKLYAHYFGASNVEYADGTHRPAAQAWYNSAYTLAGSGGNCYGMSVSSLRLKNRQFDHMFHAGHFQNAPTAQTFGWWYEWDATTRETVQQQQGAWYTQEVLDVYVNLRNNQTPRQVFTRAEALVGHATNRPVLVYWAPNWGHAVCPYATEVDGNTRRIICYDNNNPYQRNETGAIDPDVATVNWSANTFSRGTATTAQLFSYEECTPPNPHLPGAEYGGPGQDTVVAVFNNSTSVQQITDENGRVFFNPDGSFNENPETRIPLSAYLPPLVQRPQPRVLQRGPVGRLELGGLQPPANAPHIFVFGNAVGKSLTFNAAGQGGRQVDLFSNGRVFTLQFTGAGEIQFENLLQLPTMRLHNAQALAPTQAQFIRSTTAGDRAFVLTNLRNLNAQQLQLLPNAQGTELEVTGPPTLQFNLNLLGPVGQGMQQASFADLALQAGAKANLTPLNWGALQTSGLRLQQLNPQNNAVIDQRTIQRRQ